VTSREITHLFSVARDARLEGRDDLAAQVLADISPDFAMTRRITCFKTRSHRLIRRDLAKAMKEAFGPTVDLSASTIMGSLIEAASRRYHELEQQLGAVFDQAQFRTMSPGQLNIAMSTTLPASIDSITIEGKVEI